MQKNIFALAASATRFAVLVVSLSQLVSQPALASKTPALMPIDEVFFPSGTFPADRFWKVAVVQWNPPGSTPIGVTTEQAATYKKQIHAEMEDLIVKAAQAGAQYIVLSEFATVGYPDIPGLTPEEDNYRSRDDIAPYVESVPGPTTDEFAALAQRLGVWIQFGMAEVDLQDQNYYDTAVAINSVGQVAAKYRKQHLYQIEEHFLAPGSSVTTFDTPAGTFGMVVCSDIYDDGVLDRYRSLNIDALILSTSWAEQNTGMDYFKAAALHVNSYVLAANQNYFPDSGVINVDGSFQSHIRQSRSSIAYGYLPLKGR